MVDSLITKKLARAFPRSFINTSLEFIAHKKANSWFRLEDCESEFDVKCKLLEWLSRDAYKTCPFNKNIENERFHNFILNGINDFLGTDFTESDIEIIYTYLGNRCNHKKTVNFIESGYDMSVLKGGEAMRDRFIKVLRRAQTEWLDKTYDHETPKSIEEYVADYLLENGIIVPPYKVGQIVYVVRSQTSNGKNLYLRQERIDHYRIFNGGSFMCFESNRISVSSDVWSTTVFPTKEEAEKALERIRE